MAGSSSAVRLAAVHDQGNEGGRAPALASGRGERGAFALLPGRASSFVPPGSQSRHSALRRRTARASAAGDSFPSLPWHRGAAQRAADAHARPLPGPRAANANLSSVRRTLAIALLTGAL